MHLLRGLLDSSTIPKPRLLSDPLRLVLNGLHQLRQRLIQANVHLQECLTDPKLAIRRPHMRIKFLVRCNSKARSSIIKLRQLQHLMDNKASGLFPKPRHKDVTVRLPIKAGHNRHRMAWTIDITMEPRLVSHLPKTRKHTAPIKWLRSCNRQVDLWELQPQPPPFHKIADSINLRWAMVHLCHLNHKHLSHRQVISEQPAIIQL